ncbi:MAG: Gfo/Idh/MocA family oxidoreductase [Clostridia bacterium]|nr:Gfo/Idh/MocA family oxidoreductase [Clostridia bacterium]
MSNQKIKIGIIGSGFITGTQHIPAILKLGGRAEIVAAADSREDALEHIRREYGIQNIYTDPMKMLEENKFDLVHVCTANNTHKRYTIAALRTGANVLCEKPMALSLRDAQEMFHEAKKAGKALMACQNSGVGTVTEMKKLVDSGVLGQVYFTELTGMRRSGVPTWGKFHTKTDNGGGPFCDIGVHYVDSSMYILGNPKAVSVSANTYCKIANQRDANQDTLPAMSGEQPFKPRDDYDKGDFSVEDFATGLVRFENGMQMQLKFVWAVNLPTTMSYSFAGTKKGMVYKSGTDLENPVRLYGEEEGFLSDEELEIPIARPGARSDVGHPGIVENFADVIQHGAECLVKEEETLNVTAIIEAFYLSAQLGREVRIDELEQFNA